MNHSQFDAHYIGRATIAVADGMSDTIQCCMTPTGINLSLYHRTKIERARAIVDLILSETFREDLSPNAITGPRCCGECD